MVMVSSAFRGSWFRRLARLNSKRRVDAQLGDVTFDVGATMTVATANREESVAVACQNTKSEQCDDDLPFHRSLPSQLQLR